MRHRRRKTALLTAAAAAVLALQGPFAALAASPQFAYDADTWAKLQDNVMEYSELPYLVQEYNPTYLNNQTTYQAGRDTKNAKEVQDKQYNQANDLYDSADNLRDQADQIEDFLAVPGMASAYASLMSASVMVEQNALKPSSLPMLLTATARWTVWTISTARMRLSRRCSRRLLLIIRSKRQFR